MKFVLILLVLGVSAIVTMKIMGRVMGCVIEHRLFNNEYIW